MPRTIPTRQPVVREPRRTYDARPHARRERAAARRERDVPEPFPLPHVSVSIPDDERSPYVSYGNLEEVDLESGTWAASRDGYARVNLDEPAFESMARSTPRQLRDGAPSNVLHRVSDWARPIESHEYAPLPAPVTAGRRGRRDAGVELLHDDGGARARKRCLCIGGVVGGLVFAGLSVTAIYLGVTKSGLLDKKPGRYVYGDGDMVRADFSWRTPTPYQLTTLPPVQATPFESDPGIVDVTRALYPSGDTLDILVPRVRETAYDAAIAAEALARVPSALVAPMDDFSLLARAATEGRLAGVSGMVTLNGDGSIHNVLTPNANGRDVETLTNLQVHEGAHAFRFKHHFAPGDPLWIAFQAAMAKDVKRPSKYSEINADEAFAEASVLYFAAQESPEKMADLRAQLPNTVAVLAQIYAAT